MSTGTKDQAKLLVAEADGNRTRQAGDARLNGFEDRGAHQDPDASAGSLPAGSLARQAPPSRRKPRGAARRTAPR